MYFKHFFRNLALLGTLLLAGAPAMAAETSPVLPKTDIQLIRNATVKITYDNTTFLVDPMFAEPGAYPGFENTFRSELRNPLTPLPMPVEKILAGVDAVILTHTHLDHWDESAQKVLPKDIPFFVQDEKDANLIQTQGFQHIRILKNTTEFNGVTLHKTACKHGSDEMFDDPVVGTLLGNVMGIVFKAPNQKTTYLAADTVWFDGVDNAIKTHHPDFIILNTGGAALTIEKFKDNPYIIMGKKDILRAGKAAPHAKIIAVHMDAINHMTVDRKDVSEYTYAQGIRDRVFIPFDGEMLHF